MDFAPPPYGAPYSIKINSGFDENVSNSRSLNLLANSQFTFESFEERSGICARMEKTEMILWIILSIFNPAALFCFAFMKCRMDITDKV